MNRTRLTIENLWEDTDAMIEVRVTLAARGYTAWHQFYIYLERLREFAQRLQNFPRTSSDEAVLKYGSADSNEVEWFCLRAYVASSTGHCALELDVNRIEVLLDTTRFQFSAPIEAASVNELGKRLDIWAQSPMEPFVFETVSD